MSDSEQQQPSAQSVMGKLRRFDPASHLFYGEAAKFDEWRLGIMGALKPQSRKFKRIFERPPGQFDKSKQPAFDEQEQDLNFALYHNLTSCLKHPATSFADDVEEGNGWQLWGYC